MYSILRILFTRIRERRIIPEPATAILLSKYITGVITDQRPPGK